MQGPADLLKSLEGLAEPAVLATLVQVKGSSYRRPGAQMLMRPGGQREGVISAGCLEADLLARVASVLEGGRPQLATFDLGTEWDLLWGTGMGCQGRAEVLLEPALPGRPGAWMSLRARLLATRGSGALATVFRAPEDTGWTPGTRFLLEAQGPGLPPPPGPLGAELASALQRALDQGRPEVLSLPGSAGSLEALVEPILPPCALWIFGAGEHARPLARLARELGWFLGVVDHRPALASPERFPEADRLVVGRPPACLEDLPFDSRSAALVVSHGYDLDRDMLAALLDRPLGYLGLQGNRTRCARLIQDVEARRGALEPVQRQRLHAPAGLDLGSESPEAIALSTLAEIQMVLAGRGGGSLRDRTGSIH